LFLVAALVAVLLAPDAAGPASAAFPGDNGLIAVMTGGQIATIPRGGGSATPLAPGELPYWSPDGSKIAFTEFVQTGSSLEPQGSQHTDIFVMNQDGSGLFQLTHTGHSGGYMAWSPDGTQLAEVGLSDTTLVIHILSATTGIISRTIQPPDVQLASYPISWSSDGTKILFTGVGEDIGYDLYSIHPDGSGFATITTGDPSHLSGDWSPDGSKITYWQADGIYVANANGSGAHRILQNNSARYPVWSPDGSMISYNTTSGASAVWTMRSDGSNATVLTAGGFPSWQPLPPSIQVEFTQGIQQLQSIGELQASLAGSGQLPASVAASLPGDDGIIAYLSAGGIRTVLPDGTGDTLVTSSGVFPRWSPDGGSIAYIQSGQIVVADADGSNGVAIGATTAGFAWSPDGLEIATVRDDPNSDDIGRQDIWVHDLGTGAEQKITPAGVYFINSLAWSPDGSAILFAAGTSPTDTTPFYDFYTLPPGGGAAVNITRTPTVVELGADWSPDGSQIAFYGLRTGSSNSYEVSVMNADGTGARSLVPGSPSSTGPSWSPDGRRLAYNIGSEIHLIDVTGANDTFLVTGSAPDWGPAPPPLQVEFTQGIQQLQTIGELQASLAGNGQPPVPIVAGKAAVMRVYLADVDQTTNYHLEVTGEVSKSEDVTITPGCTPKDRRIAKAGCPSQDYYFTPPAGDWSVRLEVTDRSDGRVVLDETFDFASVDTDGLIIKYLPVCIGPAAAPVCPSNAIATSGDALIKTLYPVADDELFYEQLAVPPLVYPSAIASDSALAAALRQRYNLMSMGGFVADQLAGWVPPGGVSTGTLGLSDPVWLGSTGRVTWEVDTSSTDPLDHAFTLAHEIGHNYGLRHTNLSDGCGAQDGTTDWPYGDSTIQETGFDVAAKKPVPAARLDLLSYCSPPGTNIWVSPFDYKKLVQGDFNPQSVGERRPAGAAAPKLVITGTAQAGGGVTIDSAYVIESAAPPDPPNPMGNYCLHMSGGAELDYCFLLAFRNHRTLAPLSEESFSLRVPLPPGTTHVGVLLNHSELASLDASAAAPTVNITQPDHDWSGEQTITWTATDADSDPLNYAVMYSPDNGQTWLPLAVDITDPSLTLDTNQLEGNQLLVRVLASDGLNTTAATSAPITLLNSAHRTWGDFDCSGAVQPMDALRELAARSGASVSQSPGCPAVDSAISVNGASRQWGDLDCSGAADGADATLILKLAAALPSTPSAQCPRVGTQVLLD
jgi:TolB protein